MFHLVFKIRHTWHCLKILRCKLSGESTSLERAWTYLLGVKNGCSVTLGCREKSLLVYVTLEPHQSHFTNCSHPIAPHVQDLATIGNIPKGNRRPTRNFSILHKPCHSQGGKSYYKAYVKFPYGVAHQMVVKVSTR